MTPDQQARTLEIAAVLEGIARSVPDALNAREPGVMQAPVAQVAAGAATLNDLASVALSRGRRPSRA